MIELVGPQVYYVYRGNQVIANYVTGDTDVPGLYFENYDLFDSFMHPNEDVPFDFQSDSWNPITLRDKFLQENVPFCIGPGLLEQALAFER